MATSEKDPTEPIRLEASRYLDVDKGTSCTQSSFKTGKKAFLYIGTQGGRYKAMFKLEGSKAEAAKLADKDPDHFEVGSTAWVTARFTAERPMPKKLWKKWLDESYALSAGSGGGSKKKASKKKASKKAKPKTGRK
ncbi:MAG: MmcQ/YjbR family DNA-binding protein [bacterium]|nr:MmcQ/YjbR family DNA-binding protein [bacterium]